MKKVVRRKILYLDPCVQSQAELQRPYVMTTRIQTFQKGTNQHGEHKYERKHECIKDTLFSFSFSFPSTLPNGTLARPNNGILNVNLLDDGFNAVVCSKGGLFSGVCWSCSAGGVVGSDGTLSSTEHGDGSVLLFDEREAV